MSSLIEKFNDYCNDENNKGCENCQYDDGNHSDIMGCAMNFAYQQGREDAIDECIRMVEEGVYRDYGMLAEQMRELKEQKDGR